MCHKCPMDPRGLGQAPQNSRKTANFLRLKTAGFGARTDFHEADFRLVFGVKWATNEPLAFPRARVARSEAVADAASSNTGERSTQDYWRGIVQYLVC